MEVTQHEKKSVMVEKLKAQGIGLPKQVTSADKPKVGRPSNMNDSLATAIRLLHKDAKIGKRKLSKLLRVGVGTIMSVL